MVNIDNYKSFVFNTLGPSIHRLAHTLYVKHNAILLEKGLTFQQARVLFFILLSREKGKIVNAKDVEKYMGLKGSSVNSLITNMLEKDLIIKKKDENDRRYYNIEVTDKGLIANEEAFEVFQYVNSKLIEDISEEEIKKIKKILDEIFFNVDSNL